MKLFDKTTGKTVARDVELANTFWSRFRGLMLRRKFPQGKALLFVFKKPGHYPIHMSFVRFTIDLVYLDNRFKVVEVREMLRPWRLYSPKSQATYLAELPAKTVSKFNIKIGHQFTKVF
jgi:hypothetical protein